MQKDHPKVAEAVANGQSWPQDISPADVCWASQSSKMAWRKAGRKGGQIYFSYSNVPYWPVSVFRQRQLRLDSGYSGTGS
jgi:hypothetical protein